jgi:hypothetical protein
MATFKQWEKEYPDVCQCVAKTDIQATTREAMNLANGLAGPDSAILDINITDKKIEVFWSKAAKEQGVESVDLLKEN